MNKSIVILRTDWGKPQAVHGVFQGSLRAAQDWCKRHSTLDTMFHAISVPTLNNNAP